MKKIHIVHVLYAFGIGGMEEVIVDLINNLDPGTFSHSICVFKDELTSLKKIKVEGVKAYLIKRHFRHDPTTIIRLAALFRRIRPDIVGTYNWTGVEGIIAAKLSGVRTIIHSEHGFDIGEIYRKKKRREFIRKVLLKYCAKVVAISKNIERWLIDSVKVERARVIYLPNGCDIEKFHPGKDNDVRRQYGMGDGDIVFGTVGSLIELKDHESLVEAFGKIAGTRTNVKLMIVGDGPTRRKLETRVIERGLGDKVIFTGSVIDVPPFYRAMDIFLLPSLVENMPMSLLQAMATALPVIVTDVGDVEYMVDGEKGGIVVKPKDVDAFANGMKYFLDHPDQAKEKGWCARKRAEAEFGIARMKNAYEILYKSLTA